MTRTRLWWLGLAAAIVVMVSCSKSQSTNRAAERPERPVAVGTGGAGADVKNDDEFVHDVAMTNLAEIELSRTALEKASSTDVKSFAQQMIDDHGAAANALKGVISGHQSEWPAQLDDKHRHEVEDLAKKRGNDFDREYAKAMVEGHQNLAAKLESRLDVQSLSEWKTAAAARAQSKALPDPQTAMRDVKVRPLEGGSDTTIKINQWAAETYPIVQKHLDSARMLENATKKRSTN